MPSNVLRAKKGKIKLGENFISSKEKVIYIIISERNDSSRTGRNSYFY